ncbi:MAG: DUF2970 domain-containing protein, partial [Cellvibrionaceae bacterium]|nr:DUF2970 domain-containing protein [Cellvibrionaceae bacterium]
RETAEPKSKPGVFDIVLSTLAAGFGVQSDKNRERDFEPGNMLAYIVSGLLFTLLLVLGVVLVVKMVLPE